jgi:Putative NAD(P)-binding
MIFPVALDLRNRQCLVVGTGAEAAGRVEQLCAAGASVHWVTQEALLKPPNCQVSVRPFESADLSACWLVILADFNAELAQRIGTACESAQIFFCAIDQPEFNSFSHMALISAPPAATPATAIHAASGGLFQTDRRAAHQPARRGRAQTGIDRCGQRHRSQRRLLHPRIPDSRPQCPNHPKD